jgi:ABC-type transport system involved in cytochrome c biogenesis permease subunit
MVDSRTFRSILRAVSSTRIASALLLALFLQVAVGTWIEARSGLWAARHRVFDNWFWGVPLVATLAAANLMAAAAVRLPWTRRGAGLLVAHLGLILLLASGAANLALSRTAELELGPGESSNAAIYPDRWEVEFRQVRDTVEQLRGLEIGDWSPGQSVDLGGISIRLLGSVPNGAAGMGGRLSALPASNEPSDDIPAVAVRVEGDSASDAVLDRFHPDLDLGAGRAISLRRARMPLPFGIRLDSFRREVHPGSTRPKSFESQVRIDVDGAVRKADIRMNHPLRLDRFTLYQASWKPASAAGPERTVLSVVENPGSSLPYISCFLVAAGLLFHLLARRSPVRSAPIAVLLGALTLGAASPARSEVPHAVPAMGEIPIQIDGRVKSLETFAEHTLLQVSGRSSAGGLEPLDWLAALLFDPDRIRDVPLVLVENPDVRDALGLQGKDRDRYPWGGFRPCGERLDALARKASAKEAQSRDAFDREVLRLSDVWFRLRSLEDGLAFLRPGSAPPPPSILPRAPTFLDLALGSPRFGKVLDSLEHMDRSALRPVDDSCLVWFRTAFGALSAWEDAQFPVSPVPGRPDQPWRSPAAEIATRGLRDHAFAAQAVGWKGLREAWLAGNSRVQDSTARALDAAIRAQAGTSLRPAALRAEAVHNHLRPFDRATWIFLVALVCAVAASRTGRKAWRVATRILLGAGFALCAVGLGLRMAVTLRPPVTNLHETFLFVAFLTVPVLAWSARSWSPGLSLSAASGAGFLFLARAFGADGDTMPVLVAVLDSNFWLSVHVLTITAGYAAVMAAGIAAHWHLWQARKGDLRGLPTVRRLLGWGLFLTFVGTLLGGVWADQSWGRFWGWDPKENGALMIALWCALVFHARHAGIVRDRGFALGAALSVATVLFAWFGVNLLGVGLHSYGFTQGTLVGLAAYAVAETLFAVWTLSVKAVR